MWHEAFHLCDLLILTQHLNKTTNPLIWPVLVWCSLPIVMISDHILVSGDDILTLFWKPETLTRTFPLCPFCVDAGNRDVLASPGSYFFLSNSAGQGDEWLKSLNKGVWIPFTGKTAQHLLWILFLKMSSLDQPSPFWLGEVDWTLVPENNPITIFPSYRGLWTASGGDSAVWATLWDAFGSSGGWAMCEFHPGAWPAWGGLVSPAGTGQSGERAAAGFWFRGETVLWQVQSICVVSLLFVHQGVL